MVSFNITAFRPTVMGLDNDVKLMQKLGRRTAKNVAQQMRRDFAKTTRTWDIEVEFTIQSRTTSGGFNFSAGTDNEIYGYVNDGTPPHKIRPKVTNKRGLLFFQEGYKAKTEPGIIGSRAGGKSGKFVAAKEVNHPGTEARNFDKLIRAKAVLYLAKEKDRMIHDFYSQRIRQGR